MSCRFDIQMRLFAGPHTTEEVADVGLHHVFLLDRDTDFVAAELVIRKGMAFFFATGPDFFGTNNDVGGWPLELTVFHHDDGPFVSANEARNMLAVRHGGTENERVALRVF